MRLTLRYLDSDGALTDTDEMMPGAGEKDYFECETDHKKDKNYVRSDDSASIDASKIISEDAKEVVFAGLKASSLLSLRVSIYDAEKDGFFDRFWTKAVKIAFGVGLEIFAGGIPITVGNLLTALKKDPKDRPQVEQQFDDLISTGLKAIANETSGNQPHRFGETAAQYPLGHIPSATPAQTARTQTLRCRLGGS